MTKLDVSYPGSNVTNPASVQLAPGEQSALVDTRLFGPGLAAKQLRGMGQTGEHVARDLRFFSHV